LKRESVILENDYNVTVNALKKLVFPGTTATAGTVAEARTATPVALGVVATTLATTTGTTTTAATAWQVE
jgi:hypothetical protein